MEIPNDTYEKLLLNMNLSEQPQKKISDDFFPGIQRMYRKIFLCWIAVAVVVIGMSSLFANVRGKANSYQANTDWQACLTSADNQYVPIAGTTQLEPLQLTSHDPKSDFQSCIVNLARNGTCSIGCLQAMNSTCRSAKTTEELHSCVLNLCEKGTCSVDCLLAISSTCFLPVPPLNNTPTANPTPSPVLLPTAAPTYSPDDMAEFKNCLIGLEVNGTCSMECLVDIGTNCYAANTKTAMTNCIIGLYLNGSCSVQCLMGISTCQPLAPPHNDTPTAIPSFAPVVAPTRSPTNPPVFAPTTAPTYSPSEMADFEKCAIGLWMNGTCSLNCLSGLESHCASANSKEAMTNCVIAVYANGTSGCTLDCLVGISTCQPPPPAPRNDTPTAIPSFAPVVTPTRLPTNSPVFSPTTAPTYSPDDMAEFKNCLIGLEVNGTCSMECLVDIGTNCYAANTKTAMTNCIIGLYLNGSCSVQCLMGISTCQPLAPPHNDTPTAIPSFAPVVAPTRSPTNPPVFAPTTAPTYSPSEMADFEKCAIGLWMNGTCSLNCLAGLESHCASANTREAMTNCVIAVYANGTSGCTLDCLVGISSCQPPPPPPRNDTPTAIPSFAPVVTPTRSPTNPPVFAPTTAPTYSPSEIAEFKQCMAVLARNGTCSIDCVLAMNSTCSSAKTKEEVSACALSLYSNGTCSFGCLLGISSTCVPVVNNSVASFSSSSSSSSQSIYTAVPAGNLLGGLTSLGIQAVVLSALGHFAMRKTLTENSYYLPVAMTFLVWLILAIVNYSTAFAPVLPIPGDLNSSFFTIVYYELFDYRNKFENFNNGNNHCQEANRFVWFFVILISFLVLSLIGSLLLGIHVWNYLSRRHRQEQKQQESKKTSAMALNVVVGLVVLFSSLLTISKMMSSVNILNAIDHFQMNQQEAMLQGKSIWFSQIWFPFQSQQQQQSIGFDLSTLLGLLSFGGILFYQRASTNQEQSMKLLKLSFVSGLLFLVTLYPEMIGSVQFYYSHRFQNDLDCQSFFQEKSAAASYGYPDEDEAALYCSSFRLAVGSAIGFFISMHLLVASSYLIFSSSPSSDPEANEDEFLAMKKEYLATATVTAMVAREERSSLLAHENY